MRTPLWHTLILTGGLLLCSFKPDSIAGNDRKYDYYYLEATRLKADNKYSEAFYMFLHCLDIRPNAPSTLFELAQFHMALDRQDLAQKDLETAVEGAPDNYWYADMLSGFYHQTKQTAKAIAFDSLLIERFPDRQSPLMSLLQAYDKMGNYEKQIEVLNRMEKLMGKNENITMMKSKIYQEMKEPTKAFAEIESLVKERPSDMRFLTLLGDAYLQEGQNDKALQCYQQVLQTEPHNPQALTSLAHYYQLTGQTEHYNQQIDSLLLNEGVAPDRKLAMLNSITTQSLQKNNYDSLRIQKLFDSVLQINSDDVEIPKLYAQYLSMQNKLSEVVPVLKHLLLLQPEDEDARLFLLGNAIERKDTAEIRQVCADGLQIDSTKMEYYHYLGIVYYQQDRLMLALTCFQNALKHAGADTNKLILSDFYSMIGDIYHAQQSEQNSFAAYDSALVYNPDNIGALNNYAYYLSLQRRQLDKAEAMSYKTIKAEPNNPTYLDTYAWILFEKKSYTQARLYIDQAIKAIGDDKAGNETVFEHAGDIYALTGDKEGAVRWWKEARDLSETPSKVLLKKIQKRKYYRK